MAYQKKSAKVRVYSENAIDRTISRIEHGFNAMPSSKILNIIKDMIQEKDELTKSIFIRTFNELLKDYDEQFMGLDKKAKRFYIHYWVATSKKKFINHISKVEDKKFASHCICLATAFWKEIRKQALK